MTDDHLGPDQLGPNEPLSVPQLLALMSGAPFNWWVAGGWALDLFLGHQTRQHSDIEIAVLRRDETPMRKWLSSWQLWYASGPGNGLDRLREGRPLDAAVHEIWARRSSPGPWLLEVLIDESQGDDWSYRRDSRVRLPVGQIGESMDGIPLLSPEIVLLYKSKAPRERDDQDLATMLPSLTESRRVWLREAITTAHPTSPWGVKLTS